METLAGLFLAFCAIFFYCLPWLIAWARDHHQIGAIAVVNVLLGWTFLGWVISLAWSASAVRKVD